MGEVHTIQSDMTAISPCFRPREEEESPWIMTRIKNLALTAHVAGGYFRQTDESTATMMSPHPHFNLSEETVSVMGGPRPGFIHSRRRLSTTVLYYLTPKRPQGYFNRNRNRIIHTLHYGRGQCVLLHPDGHIETYIVGHNVEGGEKLQWVVEHGVYKACYLLDSKGSESRGLLISETVVPGFEAADHEFLRKDQIKSFVSHEVAKGLDWLVMGDDEAQASGKTEQQDLDHDEST